MLSSTHSSPPSASFFIVTFLVQAGRVSTQYEIECGSQTYCDVEGAPFSMLCTHFIEDDVVKVPRWRIPRGVNVHTTPFVSRTVDGVRKLYSTISGTIHRSYVGQEMYCIFPRRDGTTRELIFRVLILGKPLVTVPQTNYAIRDSTDGKLTCYVTAPTFNVTWYKDSQRLAVPSNRHSGSEERNPSLSIKQMRRDDAGTYVCTARNKAGEGRGPPIKLTITYPPEGMNVSETRIRATENRPFAVNCSVSGYPPPNLAWYRNDHVFQQGAQLSVARAGREHEGRYTCKANNSVGDVQADVQVELDYIPVVEVEHALYTTNLSESVTLTCLVRARPKVTRHAWERLEESGEVTLLVLDGVDGKYRSGGSDSHFTVTVNDFKMADRGTYRCTASNSVGTGRSPLAFVEINTRPETVVMTGFDQNYSIGDTVSLTCQGSGYPPPNFTWFLPTQSNVKAGSGSMFNFTATAELSDYIRCVASNLMGLSFNSQRLKVFHEPARKFSEKKVPGVPGKQVTLECDVTGFPPPDNYSWSLNGSKLQETSRFLPLTDLGDKHGNFTCIGSNSLGTSEPMSFEVFRAEEVLTTPPPQSSDYTSLLVTVLLVALVLLAVPCLSRLCLLNAARRRHKEDKKSESESRRKYDDFYNNDENVIDDLEVGKVASLPDDVMAKSPRLSISSTSSSVESHSSDSMTKSSRQSTSSKKRKVASRKDDVMTESRQSVAGKKRKLASLPDDVMTESARQSVSSRRRNVTDYPDDVKTESPRQSVSSKKRSVTDHPDDVIIELPRQSVSSKRRKVASVPDDVTTESARQSVSSKMRSETYRPDDVTGVSPRQSVSSKRRRVIDRPDDVTAESQRQSVSGKRRSKQSEQRPSTAPEVVQSQRNQEETEDMYYWP